MMIQTERILRLNIDACCCSACCWACFRVRCVVRGNGDLRKVIHIFLQKGRNCIRLCRRRTGVVPNFMIATRRRVWIKARRRCSCDWSFGIRQRNDGTTGCVEMMEVSLCPFSEGTLQRLSCSCLNEKGPRDVCILQRLSREAKRKCNSHLSSLSDALHTCAETRVF